MEININVDELENLIIKDSRGETYKIVKEDPAPKQHRARRYVTQTELMKQTGWGYRKIKSLVRQGLKEIPFGKYTYYDLEELDRLMEEKKI